MLTRLMSAITAPFRRSTPFEQFLKLRVAGSPNTVAKIAVNERTALQFVAVQACIGCISETKGSLPYKVYETAKSGKKSITTMHPVAQLLTTEPHTDFTPQSWSQTRTTDKLTGGNSYTEIVLDGDGIPFSLIPRHWSLVTPFRDRNGNLMYRLEGENGGPVRILDRSQMLHVPYGAGIVGTSPIRMHAEAIAIGLAQDRFVGSYFGNSARPSVALTVPGILGDDAYKRLKEDIEENYSRDKAHRPILVEGGGTVTALAIPFEDAMLLSLELTEERVCRIYRLPPHMIGLLRRATFSNIEAQDLSFEKHTMRPHCIADEQELKRKLFSRSEWGRFEIKHNLDALLRADIKTRYEAYKTGIMSGFLTQNEVRALEDRDAVEGGDVLLRPEAIFGKSGGVSKRLAQRLERLIGLVRRGSPDPAETPDRRSPDPRLIALTEQTLRGLIGREITHADRAAAKPHEYRQAITALYEKHRDTVAEKLDAFDGRPVLARIEQHRDALLALDGSAALAHDVRALTASWSDEASDLANKLCST